MCLPRVRTQRTTHSSTTPTTTTKSHRASGSRARYSLAAVHLRTPNLHGMAQLLDPITRHSTKCSSTATRHAVRRGSRIVDCPTSSARAPANRDVSNRFMVRGYHRLAAGISPDTRDININDEDLLVGAPIATDDPSLWWASNVLTLHPKLSEASCTRLWNSLPAVLTFAFNIQKRLWPPMHLASNCSSVTFLGLTSSPQYLRNAPDTGYQLRDSLKFTCDVGVIAHVRVSAPSHAVGALGLQMG